ncbi:hypothetical protein PABG_06523 [Paracoccidioides brasiliensis Pb03]|nr:hypothetical protein PABG_06523 [Paracoccidioides brasiliensis Pb03]
MHADGAMKSGNSLLDVWLAVRKTSGLIIPSFSLQLVAHNSGRKYFLLIAFNYELQSLVWLIEWVILIPPEQPNRPMRRTQSSCSPSEPLKRASYLSHNIDSKSSLGPRGELVLIERKRFGDVDDQVSPTMGLNWAYFYGT